MESDRINAASRCLPVDAQLRSELHNEVHARPCSQVVLPAYIRYVAVLNAGIPRAHEWDHLQTLPGRAPAPQSGLIGHFLRLEVPGATVMWERHSEFTRYTIQQHLASVPAPGDTPSIDSFSNWLADIPGQTMVAIELLMLPGHPDDSSSVLKQAQQWLRADGLVASVLGTVGHSASVTDFQLRENGYERVIVFAHPDTSVERAGRISQRLLEMETYRLMALRGLPAAKALTATLNQTEQELAEITVLIEQDSGSDPELLHRLAVLAARVEQAAASHTYRFDATAAYYGIVKQRIRELRERPIQGIQTIGEFMSRRLSPAMATVAATSARLSSLSERVARTTALLRTRVDIATERQNQQLLEKLTQGQALQLRLQATVEGLSIAAISYYVISLILYAAKAGKALGLPIHPELLAGCLIPLVLWGVWKVTNTIHRKLHDTPSH